jgi:hypothetical protein
LAGRRKAVLRKEQSNNKPGKGRKSGRREVVREWRVEWLREVMVLEP